MIRDEIRDDLGIAPPSAYEAVTRQMVHSVRDDVAEIKNRVNSLFWLMAGTVAVDVVLRLAGVGK